MPLKADRTRCAGRHEVSAYTFNEDEAVELAQWKPFDVLLVTPEVTAAEAQEVPDEVQSSCN